MQIETFRPEEKLKGTRYEGYGLTPIKDFYPAVSTAMINDPEFQKLIGRLVDSIRTSQIGSNDIQGSFNNIYAYTQGKWGMGREKIQHIYTTSVAFRIAIADFKEKNPIQ